MKKILKLIALLMIVQVSFAQQGANDPTFNTFDDGTFGDGANNQIRTTAVQTDGKIIMGGDFTSFNGTTRNGIARLNTNGSLDTSFNPGSGAVANGIVYTTAIQSDGKIIIGGDFTSFNGTTSKYITRLNSDGSLDTTFNTVLGANSDVRSLVLQSDGKIIIGGAFTSFNGIARTRIARLNVDGSLDITFDPGLGANNIVSTITLQNNGKIIIGGYFTSFNGTASNYITRLNNNGSLDSTYALGSGASNVVLTSVLQPDGKIIIGGSFISFNGNAKNGIARLNTDGSLDTTFNPGSGANSTVLTTNLQPDGKIVIGGPFTSFNGTATSRITRLNADGSLDTSFNTGSGANSFVLSTALQPDGKIIIGGAFISFNDTTRYYTTRLNTNGSLDTTFNPGAGANDAVFTTTLQTDNKIIIGGQFTSFNGTTRNRIARLNADGSLDTTFNPGSGANIYVSTIALQPDGKIIIGGIFTSYNGTARNRIARLNADGSLDTTFNPGTGANDYVSIITLQSDGKIIIGGQFTSFNGTARNYIARLNADGSLDTTFNSGSGASNSVSTIALQPDGKIIIGGQFTSFNGTARNRIARLNTDGSLDTTFDPGTGSNNLVRTTTLQTDGKIIIGGAFTSFNGTARNRIVRLNADGSLDTTFNIGSGANDEVLTTALQPDSKIIIGGVFTSFNGTTRNDIARLNTDGSLDTTFDPGASANAFVSSTTIQPDGNIIIGGTFDTYNGVPRHRIARVIGNAPLSTADVAIQKLHYYPNPTRGLFHITATTPITAVNVTNVLGQKIKSFVFDAQEIDLNLEDFTAGIYIIDISSNGAHKSIKVIKE
jgi:uncharacterized delta-60 repeat protein